MSWPQWPGGAMPQAGIVQTPIVNPAANVINATASMMSANQYTPEQWAQMQNWQQWAQWQQQFQQWQQQYGAEYQKSITALAQSRTPQIQQQPVPFFNVNVAAPPLPTENKPPLPPEEPHSGNLQQPLNVNMGFQPQSFLNAPPPSISQSNFTSAPPPQTQPHFIQHQQNLHPLPNQGGLPPNRAINPGFNNNNNLQPQPFVNNPNFARGGNVREPNFISGNPIHKPEPAQVEPGNRPDLRFKRALNPKNDPVDVKRNKIEQTERWQGNQQQNQRWNESPQSQQQWKQPEATVAKSNPEELTDAEKKFDKQFADWESQFQKWKEQNANHPDKEQYREYEKKWETWRTQLLERREQMRRKRLGLVNASPQPGSDKPLQPVVSEIGPQSKPTDQIQTENTVVHLQQGKKLTPSKVNQFSPGTHSPAVMQNVPKTTGISPSSAAKSAPIKAVGPTTATIILDNEQKRSPSPDIEIISYSRPPPNMNNQPLNFKSSSSSIKNEEQQRDKTDEKSDNDTENKVDFLKSSASDVIPGLDLVKDAKSSEEEEHAEEDAKNLKGADLEAISRGINSILGDQKLLNMLSIVTQTQNRPSIPPAVNTTSSMKTGPPKFSPKEGNEDHQNNRFSYKDDRTPSGFNVNHDFDQDATDFSHDSSVSQGRQFLPNPGRNSDYFGGDGGDQFDRNSARNFDRTWPNSDNFNRGPAGFDRSDNFNRVLDSTNFRGGDFNRGKPGNFNNGGGGNNFSKGPDNFGSTVDNFNNYNTSNDYNRRPNNNFNRFSGDFRRNPDDFNNMNFNDRGPDNNFNNKTFGNFNQDPNSNNRINNLENRSAGFTEAPPDKFIGPRMMDNYREQSSFNMGISNFDQNRSNVREIGMLNAEMQPDMHQQPQTTDWNDRKNSFSSDNLPLRSVEFVGDVETSAMEEGIWKPANVIDYEHKSTKPAEPDVILEPIHSFDYRHKPLNRIPYPLRPKWLSEMVKGFPEFNLSIPRFESPQHTRRYPPPPNERYDNFQKYEDRDRKSSYDDRKLHGNRDNNPYRKPFDNKLPPDNRRPHEFGDRKSPPDVSFRSPSKAFGARDSENHSLDDYYENVGDSPPFEKWDGKEDDEDEEMQDERIVKTVTDLTSTKSRVTLIEDLLNPPGRFQRPPRLVVILRGPPGSGKSFLAKLIKDKEVENGGSAPRIICLDDYFMVEQDKEIEEDGKKTKIKEMVYEYEEDMETSYRQSLMKSFKKTITDGYFNFIIVDNINDKVKYFGEMWSFAKQNGFQVYVCQLELDVQTCTKRNMHGRTEGEVEKIVAGWEPTPAHHQILDSTTLIQSGSIPEVEMEEINSPPSSENMNEEEHFTSKWDNFDYSVDNLAKLDGTNKPLRPSRTMEDYLQMDDDWVQPANTKPGQKRVRWADLEERKKQEKMRAIGFVVGQTNWDIMMNPTMGAEALTQTKYIERYNS